MRNKRAFITGHAEIRGKLASLDLVTNAADLRDSVIRLRDVRVLTNGKRTDNFWFRLRANPCMQSDAAEHISEEKSNGWSRIWWLPRVGK